MIGTLVACLGLACDPLVVPQSANDGGVTPPATDGGSSSGNPGNDVPLPSYAPPGAIKGEVKLALNSTLATWATLDADGKVETVGWNLPLSAVAALDGAIYDQRTFMAFPPEVSRDTVVTSMSYGYLATGHLPSGVYSTPHLDFHVAVQAPEEIQATDCSDLTMPADEIVPQGWGMIPPPDNCVPLMGLHAIDFSAPEFNGQRFTTSSVLIYYQGNLGLKGKGAKLSSFEPKFTAAFIKERKTFPIPMPQFPPNSIGRAGLQPTKIIAEYNAEHDVYIITASDWIAAD